MDGLFTIIGVAGSILCILMYFMLERGQARASDIWYYALNGLGAAMVIIGVMYNFDGGDLGAVTQGLCWVLISGIGVYKLIKKKKAEKREYF